ncbi:hypothetical protein J3F83DRAFT_739895, partial [Trichoderma novae-zelandiae]
MAPFPLELPNDCLFNNLKHNIAVLLDHVQSASFEFLAFLTSILWAGIQRKLLLHLRAVWSGRRWNDVTRRYEHRTSCFRELDDGRSEYRDKVGECVAYIMPYLSMYITLFPDDARVPAKTLLIQVAIGSIPLALPFWFYHEWPMVSKLFLMWWAKIWLLETVSWTENALFLAFPILSMLAFMGHFCEVVARRLAETEPPEQPHPSVFAEAWRVSLLLLEDLLPRIWEDVFLSCIL